MPGAENVTIPNQTHVQTCTSAESFIQYFKFLMGSMPANDIVPQNKIQIAGKAVDFPQNTGLTGATLQIWPVNAGGYRYIVGPRSKPVATITLEDGSVGGGRWGPVTVHKEQRYEFAISQAGLPTLHIYYEPFVRSDYTLRLEASPAIEAYTGNRESSGAVMIRYKEYWGDQPAESDQLLINGLNVCTAKLCPATKQVNAFFAFDRESKKETTLSEDPVLSALPFIQGADVYIPSEKSPPTSGHVVSYQLNSRGGGGVRTLDTPPWESKTDEVTIQWRDFEKLTF
jgi:hypothetical protein